MKSNGAESKSHRVTRVPCEPGTGAGFIPGCGPFGRISLRCKLGEPDRFCVCNQGNHRRSYSGSRLAFSGRHDSTGVDGHSETAM